ncbi:MAG: hypothetical protein ABDI07_12165 [Candidatus Kryptonium sp.]
MKCFNPSQVRFKRILTRGFDRTLDCCFNPSQVRFKQMINNLSLNLSPMFQSLTGTIQTVGENIIISITLASFNPSQVRFKLIIIPISSVFTIVSIPHRFDSNYIPHHP